MACDALPTLSLNYNAMLWGGGEAPHLAGTGKIKSIRHYQTPIYRYPLMGEKGPPVARKANYESWEEEEKEEGEGEEAEAEEEKEEEKG